MLTPEEALELALVKGGVREAVIAWGPTEDHVRHRLRNVDLLLDYAAHRFIHAAKKRIADRVFDGFVQEQ